MDFRIPPFSITVNIALKSYRMLVTQYYASEQIEKFEVRANNKFIILESNRPALRLNGLTVRKPQWKLRETSVGLKVWNQSALEAIQEEI